MPGLDESLLWDGFSIEESLKPIHLALQTLDAGLRLGIRVVADGGRDDGKRLAPPHRIPGMI